MAETKELILPSRIESVDEAAMHAEICQTVRVWEMILSPRSIWRFANRSRTRSSTATSSTTEKDVEMTFLHSAKGFEITVRDYGAGFDLEIVPIRRIRKTC